MFHCKLRLQSLAIPMMMCMIGCAGSNEDAVVRFLNTKPGLTAAERQYAIRYYTTIIVSDGYPEELAAKMDRAGQKSPYPGNPQLMGQSFYPQWGLGSGPFSLHEKAYLDNLEIMVRAWESYRNKLSSIDLNNLHEDQIRWLKSIHDKCGPGPVNFRLCTQSAEKDKVLVQRVFDSFYVLTGHDELTDKELLAVR